MKEYSISNQIAIFADLSSFIPTPIVIADVLTKTQAFGLIPQIINEITPRIAAPEARLRLINQQENWYVDFATERLNFIFQDPNDNISNKLPIVKGISDAIGIQKFSRIGIVQVAVLKPLAMQKNEDIRKYTSPSSLSFLNGKDCFEWASRHAINETIQLSTGTEKLNCIYSINKGKYLINASNKVTDGDRIIISFDANTSPDAKAERLEIPDVDLLLKHATSQFDAFVSEIASI